MFNKTTLQSSYPTTGYLPEKYKNINSKGYMHPYVYCNNIYNSQLQEQPKCPSIDEWVKKMLYIYIIYKYMYIFIYLM